MTAKFKLTFSYLIVVITIFSCGNTDNGKSIAEPKSSLNIGGTYSFGEDVEKGAVGSVIVYPLTDTSALFFLDVCRGAPSYNLGHLLGQMTIKDNVGTYAEIDSDYMDCVLKFEFNKDELIVTTEEGHYDCGFGHAVYADHIYNV